jgi:hypothetical protein
VGYNDPFLRGWLVYRGIKSDFRLLRVEGGKRGYNIARFCGGDWGARELLSFDGGLLWLIYPLSESDSEEMACNFWDLFRLKFVG